MKTKEKVIGFYEKIEDKATKLFDGIWEDGAMWMQTPQDKLGGITPSMIIAIGHGKLLLDWMNQSDKYDSLPTLSPEKIGTLKELIDSYLDSLSKSPTKDSKAIKEALAKKGKRVYKTKNQKPKKPLI